MYRQNHTVHSLVSLGLRSEHLFHLDHEAGSNDLRDMERSCRE